MDLKAFIEKTDFDKQSNVKIHLSYKPGQRPIETDFQNIQICDDFLIVSFKAMPDYPTDYKLIPYHSIKFIDVITPRKQ